MTYVVIDNFLENFQEICDTLYDIISFEYKNVHLWHDIDNQNRFSKISNKVLNEVKIRYDTSKCVGFEIWTHNKSLASNGLYHIDKDEYLMKTKEEYSYPICSSVLYLSAQLAFDNGKLFIENDVITPKENRLIIFDSGIPHRVSPISVIDKRCSLNINFWNYKINLI